MTTTRFATFNIWSGRTRQKRPNLRLYRDSLSQLNADVVGMQEVDVWSLRSGRVDLAGEGANQLDAESVFAPARRRWDMGKYGNALLVKGKVLDSEIVKLQRTKLRNERRIAQIATVIVNDVRWNVANTHLSLELDEQRSQLQQIAEQMGKKDGPRVLLGDFNMTPDDVNSTLEPMGWNVLKSDFTYPSWQPDHTVDFICLQGAVADAIEVKSLEMSDHAALIADLRPL